MIMEQKGNMMSQKQIPKKVPKQTKKTKKYKTADPIEQERAVEVALAKLERRKILLKNS